MKAGGILFGQCFDAAICQVTATQVGEELLAAIEEQQQMLVELPSSDRK